MWIVLWAFTWIGILFTGNYYSDDRFRWPLNMVLFAAIIQSISFTYSNWARMVLYFGMFSILLLPKIITVFEDMNTVNKSMNWLIEGVFMAVMFIWFAMFGIPEYLPMWR